VLETSDYYPYGMEMAGGFKRISAKKNRFLFNQGTGDKKFNTERITDLELSLDMTKYRLYDYQIGRFVQSDPLADASPQEAWTPYQYGYNNPVSYNDPYGDCPVCLIGGLAFLGYMLSAKPANAPSMDAEANKEAMVEAQDSYDRSIVGSTVAALAIGQILYEDEWGTRDSEPKPENQEPGKPRA
ncbi:RHS repeat domain-containing protein, partial [Fulvivirga kasyanovii]